MRKTSFKFLTAFAIIAATFASTTVLMAQETPGSASQEGKKKSTKKAPPRVIELEELVIEGRVQKPEVFYILGRAETHYRELKLERDFVDRIVKSVKTNAF